MSFPRPAATALRKRFSPVLWGCVVAMMLVGCQDRVADDGRVRVVYWEKWTGAEAAALQETVDTFNASQDRIFVELLTVSGIDRKTILATAGGAPPDIAGVWVQQISSWADMNALQPLDEFMREEGNSPEAFMARYEKVYAEICYHQGRVFGLPSTPASVALHWNKTLFREAGLDPERPPQTVEELMEFSKKLTRRDPRTGELLQVGFLPQDPGWWPWAFYPWFGGSLMDENGAITIGTDPDNFRAAEWIKSYTDFYGADDLKIFSSGFGQFSSAQYPFFAGKVAMVVQGVWLNNYMRQFAPGLDYGAAAWPVANEEVGPFSVCEADMLVIPRGAKHPHEAWEFIKYLASNNPSATTREELSGGELLCYLHEKNSPLKVWSPFFENNHPHPYIKTFRELARLPTAQRVPAMGIWQEYNREVRLASERIWLGESEVEPALAYAQARTAASWDEHRKSVERQRRAGGLEVGPPLPTGSHSVTKNP